MKKIIILLFILGAVVAGVSVYNQLNPQPDTIEEIEPKAPEVMTQAEAREWMKGLQEEAAEELGLPYPDDTRPALNPVDGTLTSSVEHGYVKARGQVVNNTAGAYSYVSIEFGIYTLAGAKVGTAIDNITNLGPGETWEYSAIGYAGDDDYYEIRLEDLQGW